MIMSWMGVVGRLSCSGCQCAPSSNETQMPVSVLADGVNIGIVREAGEEFRPRFSIVAGLENERLEIVELVSVDSDVSGCSVERRSFDKAHHGPLRHFFWSHIRPRLAFIASELNQA